MCTIARFVMCARSPQRPANCWSTPKNWCTRRGMPAGRGALRPNAKSEMNGTSTHLTVPAMGVAIGELTHLDRLEAESIHIIREVTAEAERPVMLYSIGKGR
jgi:hypothetical protein